MRVATFNVHHGAPRRGDADLAATVDACRSLDVDVLALQELDSGASRSGGVDQPAVIADVLAMQIVFAPTVALRGGGHYGHALLSRRPLREVEVLALTGAPGREPRVAILARTSTGDGEVSIASTHLQNERRGDPLPPLAIRQLREVVAALGARPGPRVALGDLNLEDDVVTPILQQVGLVAARTTPTFPSDRPRSTPDHIALGGLTVVSSAVPSTSVSDHRPVVVEMAAVDLSAVAGSLDESRRGP